jgi:hypothetical protein
VICYCYALARGCCLMLLFCDLLLLRIGAQLLRGASLCDLLLLCIGARCYMMICFSFCIGARSLHDASLLIIVVVMHLFTLLKLSHLPFISFTDEPSRTT